MQAGNPGIVKNGGVVKLRAGPAMVPTGWRSQTGRPFVWASLAALAIVGLVAVVVAVAHRTVPFPVDGAANTWVSQNRTATVTAAARVFDQIGAGTLGDILIPGVIVVAFLLARRWPEAIILVAALLLSGGAVRILKATTGRLRPPHGLIAEPSLSFPSGHATHAATLVVVLILVLRWRWLIVVGTAYAVAMAASRVYLGVHWVSDVVVGLLFGATIATLLVALAGRLLRPRAL